VRAYFSLTCQSIFMKLCVNAIGRHRTPYFMIYAARSNKL